MYLKKYIFVRRILTSKMRTNPFFAFIIILFVTLSSCKEPEQTADTEKNGMTEESTETEAMEKISPDGTINAKLTCEGASKIEALVIKGQELIPDGFTCSIRNGSTLTITFSSDAAVITFDLFGAGSLPIQTGDYPHMTKGTTPYATVFYKDQTNGNVNGDVKLDIFEGQVTIADYGMSSNTICGSFDISDNEGNTFKGTFNQMISSF